MLARDLAQPLPLTAWKTVHWREGSKGVSREWPAPGVTVSPSLTTRHRPARGRESPPRMPACGPIPTSLPWATEASALLLDKGVKTAWVVPEAGLESTCLAAEDFKSWKRPFSSIMLNT